MTIQASLHGKIGKLDSKNWNGRTFKTLSVAVNQGPEKSPLWVEAAIWAPEQQAKLKECSVGDHVLLQGNLSLEEYTTKSQEKKTTIKLSAQNISLIRKKAEQKDPIQEEREEAPRFY
jgi:hypothetical protein